MSVIFNIIYKNELSGINGQKFPVREIDGFPDHYFISDGKSHVGGGKLLRKYCVKVIDEVVKLIKLDNLIEAVKLLADEESINTEYNRALCEVVAELDPIEDVATEDRARQIADELGINY